MIVASCTHESHKKHGKDRKGNQRFRCLACGATFVNETAKPLGDMRIDMKDACQALSMLLEGMSVRAVERITGLHRDTICDLILVVGQNCERFLARKVRDVKATDIQCDEIWSFVGMKEKNRIAQGFTPDFGDSWTFIAIERNTKLVLAYQVGPRDHYSTRQFLHKLNDATAGHFQISTDGANRYTNMIPFIFGSRCDYGQIVKNYAGQQSTTRYSPAKIISSEKKAVFGAPEQDRISTSHVERLNLSLRMQVRRFTRLTNAHSKSLKHHAAMQAIFFAAYNFVRKHESLKMTPAQASGLADKQWSIQELLQLAAG
jgi:transposase-like protein/IS1 family transposase